MVKISDIWTFDEFAQSVENQRKEAKNMKKALTWKEFYKLALRNYENGGDGIVECWDENTFNEYVNEFGPITEKVALNMFDTAVDVWNDMQGYADW